MRGGSSSFGPSQRKLLLGLAVMAAIILVQGALGASVATHADADARTMFAMSLESVREVSRVAHDVDEERALVNEHILERDVPAMAAIEARLSASVADRRQAMRRYSTLVSLPREGELWRQVEKLQGRFDQRLAEVVELSRRNADVAARARLVDGQKDHMDLDSKLVDLTQLNLDGVGQAMDHVRALQTRAEMMQWGARGAGLLALLLFGLWGTRRIVKYERQIKEYAREIEERNQDLDAFAGRVAHDLRNALAPVALSAPALRCAAHDAKQVERIALRIGRCSDRAVAIVDALLAFSRAGRQAGADECGSLRATLGSVEEELAPEIRRLDVAFEVAAVPDLELRCTSGLLHVVLANLCGNAVKYLEGRSVRQVGVSARQEGALCRIEVEDSGPGIPTDLQQKIFEPFFRVDPAAAHGTGIGLATVHRIVDARGGRIEVESELGRGSRFIIWMPLAPGRESRRPRREASSFAKAEIRDGDERHSRSVGW